MTTAIDKPGIHTMTAEEYHADPVVQPSLSSSIAKILVEQTPRHAWLAHPRLNSKFEREDKTDFDIGNAAHALMLRDRKAFAVLDFDSYRTNASKDARAAAYADRLIPILADQWGRVNDMVRAGRAQLARHAEASDAFANGWPEQAVIWREGLSWCRALFDFLPIGSNVFYDYKTTGAGAGPDDFGARSLFNLGHDIQAAFYCRGARAALDIANPIFRFVVQETEPPYALAVHQLSPEAMAYADRKVEYALGWWRWCMERNAWPGYPGRVHHIELPPWHATRQEERDLHMALAREGDTDLFKLAIDWQAPL